MSSISAILPCLLAPLLANTDICFNSLYLSLTYSVAPGMTKGDPWVTQDDPWVTQDDPWDDPW